MKNTTLKYIQLIMKSLQGRLHIYESVYLRGNDLEGSNHSKPLRLDLHPHRHTLYPVQLRSLG